MKVAVVGAGIFGITTSVKLARAGIEVDLFEQGNDILSAASSINQLRLHRGYHYPRSPETVRECLDSEPAFRAEYGLAVIDSGEHFYCIVRDKSLVSGAEYENFCKGQGLSFERSKSPLINQYPLDLCIKVQEGRIDPAVIRSICAANLRSAGVSIKLGVRAEHGTVSGYDHIVLATYASLNELAGELAGKARKLQFEVCEKPVIRLPDVFGRTGIVIMDGPFMCIDPFGQTDTYLLGNVVWAIHQSNIGYVPEISPELAGLINKGVVRDLSVTNFDKFIESGTEFIPILRQAKHIGSMFTIRTVLPGVDSTDTRPTIVTRLSDKVISVFSGKLGTCVTAAEQVLEMVKPRP